MTASKLEESIGKLAAKIVGVDRGSLPDALHAFAEAVREKMPVEECRKTHKWEWMCRECGVKEEPKCSCPCHKDQACYACKKETCWKPPEPKECEHDRYVRVCNQFGIFCTGCNQKIEAPAALPDEVKEKMFELTKSFAAQMRRVRLDVINDLLEDLCKLCLSLRKP